MWRANFSEIADWIENSHVLFDFLYIVFEVRSENNNNISKSVFCIVMNREFAALAAIRQDHRKDFWGKTLTQISTESSSSLNTTNHSHIPQV